MKSVILLCLCTLWCFLCSACSNSGVKDASAQRIGQGQTSTHTTTNEVKSSITNEKLGSFEVEAKLVNGGEALDVLHFLDQSHGWVAGGRTMYSTSDSGKTWKRVKIQIPQTAKVTDIFFVNSSLGWVAMQKDTPDVTQFQNRQIWLMHTSDGGRNWQLQHEDVASAITRVAFVGEQEGWLTGVKYTGIRPLGSQLLILHTSNHGESWNDVSQELNRISANDVKSGVNDWITDIIPEGPLTATVLTQRGKIFKTINGGEGWRQAGLILNEPSQTCICRLGSNNGGEFLWVAGGADSVEGMWGMLAKQQDTNLWVRHRISGFYLADLLFLSDQEVFACGSVPAKRRRSSGIREGVVLYSPDGGYNWSVLYHNPQVEKITALAAVDSKHVRAVGDHGLVLSLKPAE